MPNARLVENGATGQGRNGSGSGPFIEEAIRFAGTLSARRVSGAEQLNMLAQSARGLGETFDDLPVVRDQLAQAAEMIDEWAEYIRSTDIRDMAGDARQLVIQHPYATFAVAIAIGLAAGGYARTRSRARPATRTGNRTRGRGRPGQQRASATRGARRDDTGSARSDAN